ncbi:hypothetical protein HEK616_80640 (plasmid) [Streptomyces nigrescens]|uniref:Uncharacterized protein n=2 Tax=Streptomyces TaxID=1883 RepID=A0ABN6R9Z5_STRNI|nr:hypothetical protein [Streptomyces nigrescens]MEE4420704.1 hypothetical protein [Streptomyces sp. DSM 41528]BDM74577.1 hypothetical protein HEK616_80640 [Streptomyces nigrescens]
MTEENAWTSNPLLQKWLARQQAGFEEWAQETGGGWDFSVDSLDRLEDLIRSRYSSIREIEAAEETPFVQVAFWYFGEVFCRCHGLVWQQRPGGDPEDKPFVIGPGDGGLDEDDERPATNPDGEIPALFLRGEDNHLRDALEGWL